MFIGHIPAGYLWTRLLIKKSKPVQDLGSPAKVLAIGMFASIIPDFDLFYHYLFDLNHPHHSYWTHVPGLWIAIFGVGMLAALLLKKTRLIGLGIVMGSNILVHLTLDTVAGRIMWLYPFSDMDFVLALIPAVHGWWVWNFVLHWTFLLEMALLVAAIYVWRSGPKRQTDHALIAATKSLRG